MTSLVARKISSRRSALVIATALFNCGAAFAAETVEDAQALAQALLSGVPGIRATDASTALPDAAASASVTDPQDRARGLLTGSSRLPGASVRTDASGTAASAASVGNQGTAYAGAQESARKMILGSGA